MSNPKYVLCSGTCVCSLVRERIWYFSSFQNDCLPPKGISMWSMWNRCSNHVNKVARVFFVVDSAWNTDVLYCKAYRIDQFKRFNSIKNVLYFEAHFFFNIAYFRATFWEFFQSNVIPISRLIHYRILCKLLIFEQ